MGQSMTKRFFTRKSPVEPSAKISCTDRVSTGRPNPYIFTRWGSMYFDEDGDLAHEFYVEVNTTRGTMMRREPLERLRPQGEIELPHPRFNVDFPVIMYEISELPSYRL